MSGKKSPYLKRNRVRLTDFEKLHSESIGAKALNDSDLTGKKLTQERISQLFYDIEPELGFVATCECKEYRGNFYAGYVCPICKTTVSTEFTSKLGCVNWLIFPDHLPSIMHPVFYAVLSRWLGKVKSEKPKSKVRKIPLLQAILDPTEELPHGVRSHIRAQGFRYFEKHTDEIMDFFFNTYKLTKSKKDLCHVKDMYEQYKHLMWIRKFPSLHPVLTPIAKECKMKAIDNAAGHMMSAASDLSTLAYESKRCLTDKTYVDRQLWKVYESLIAYTENIIEKKFGDKFAQARRHNMGARVHFSARSVIVPIVSPHEGDEIYIPMKIAMGALKGEILNVLMNRSFIPVEESPGYKVKRPHTLNEALAKYMRGLVVFDEDIHRIIMKLIEECPYKGLPLLVGRNPTLVLGAIQLLYMTKVKTDMADETISISARICKAPNADFDGDEMYILFIKEMGMVPFLQNLHPRMTILSKSDLAVGGLVMPTNQATVHINSFLSCGMDTPKHVRFEM